METKWGQDYFYQQFIVERKQILGKEVGMY